MECREIENKNLSEIASQMCLERYEQSDSMYDYRCIDLDSWPGEIQQIQRISGEKIDVPVSPFLDRDCDLYDFDYESECVFYSNIE